MKKLLTVLVVGMFLLSGLSVTANSSEVQNKSVYGPEEYIGQPLEMFKQGPEVYNGPPLQSMLQPEEYSGQPLKNFNDR